MILQTCQNIRAAHTMPTLPSSSLISQLPAVRGRYAINAPLAPSVWFRSGGNAEVLYKPQDLQDLQFFLKNKPKDLPVTTIGVGSNLLIRDGGVPGVVIRLGKGFNNIAINGQTIEAGAAVLDRNLAIISCDQALTGLEFLSTIPGTLGGALRMNAGCYEREIKDCLDTALVLDPKGSLHELSVAELGYSYRHCSLPEDWIFVGARLKVTPGDKATIESTINSMIAKRDASQPTHVRTGGSTFANPEGHSAWKLIDEAGCRGLKRGDAQISEKHCNFLINTGSTTSKDLEELGEEVRTRVLKTSGIQLRWEIQRIGTPLSSNTTAHFSA